MNAYLPDELEEVTLEHMVLGEEAWTLPWGMFADESGALWLHPHYPVLHEPQGTAQLRVVRVDGGYIADVTMCADYGWSRGRSSFVGGVGNPLPVVGLLK